MDLETFKRQWNVRLFISLQLPSPFGAVSDLHTIEQIECPRATERLRVNLPSTIVDPSPLPAATSTPTHAPSSGFPAPGGGLHGATGNMAPMAPPTATPSNSQVLLATESFITFLDALKLGMASKDALHPLLAELIQAVNAVTERDFDGRGKIIQWLIRLNGMRAQEELDRDVEVRQVAFDIEGAYRGFKGMLS